MELSILCVVVLYGMQVKDSPSFQAIRKQAAECNVKIGFYIHDNSAIPDPTLQKGIKDIEYVYSSQNIGLSAAYNAAALRAKKQNFEWVLLLDQDTQLPNNFLQSYVEAISKNKERYSVFAPKIKELGGAALSPIQRWKKNQWPNCIEGEVPIKPYLLINSCLCIKTQTYLNCEGYNEKVWLDFSDLQFIQRLQRNGIDRFYLLPCQCTQDFSKNEQNIEKLKRRFDIYIQCAKHCENFGLADWVFRQYAILSHTLALSIKTLKGYFIWTYVFSYIFKF